jgi:hypothetical protein
VKVVPRKSCWGEKAGHKEQASDGKKNYRVKTEKKCKKI